MIKQIRKAELVMGKRTTKKIQPEELEMSKISKKKFVF